MTAVYEIPAVPLHPRHAGAWCSAMETLDPGVRRDPASLGALADISRLTDGR